MGDGSWIRSEHKRQRAKRRSAGKQQCIRCEPCRHRPMSRAGVSHATGTPSPEHWSRVTEQASHQQNQRQEPPISRQVGEELFKHVMPGVACNHSIREIDDRDADDQAAIFGDRTVCVDIPTRFAKAGEGLLAVILPVSRASLARIP